MDYVSKKKLYNKLEDIMNNPIVSIQGTTETPEVEMNSEKGLIKFSGRSLPENAKEFYQPLLEWIESYSENPKPDTKVVFQFEYFNTASSKMIWECIDAVRELKEKSPDATVEWHYLKDDDDMLEAGEDYAEMIGIDFQYISYE